MSANKVQFGRPVRARVPDEFVKPRTQSDLVGAETPNVIPVKKGAPSSPSIEGGEGLHLPWEGEVEKEKSNKELVLSLALKLSTADRKWVLAQLALAAHAVTGEGRDLDMFTLAVQDALHAPLGGADGGGVGLIPLRRLLAPSTVWGKVEEFMHRADLHSGFSVPERQAVYNMLADLVVAHAVRIAQHIGTPISAKFVVNCAGNVAAIFEAAFPGYLRMGLAPVVARRYVQGEREYEAESHLGQVE